MLEFITRLFKRKRPPTTSPTPVPTPIPAPTPTPTHSRYVLLNCITWQPDAFKTLPYTDVTELTYFVLPVAASGELLEENGPLESAFVINAHNAGKKATFSIAGGAQNTANVTEAVTNNSTIFITHIVSHLQRYGYDGVTIDIENTNIDPIVMSNFVLALRARMNTVRTNLIIGCYIQPWQLNTVWSNLSACINAMTWISPMLYDAGYYNRASYVSLMNALVQRVGKTKVLCGLAVNYPAADGGLNEGQYAEMLDVVNTENWLGVGLWQNVIFTESYRAVQRSKFSVR